MQRDNAYSFGKTVPLDHAATLEKTREALKEQGFGILSEIDVRAKFAEKLGIDYRPYVILGACNPPLARQALDAEVDLGVLLPCNVVVYVDNDGQTTVMAMDPAKAMQMIGNPAVAAVGVKVRELLAKALDRV